MSWTPIGSPSGEVPPRTTADGQPVRLWTSLYVSAKPDVKPTPCRQGRARQDGADDQVEALHPAQHARPDVVDGLDEGSELVARQWRWTR